MIRLSSRALVAVALAVPVGGLAQLPGAKYPPAKGTPAPFVPKNRNDRPGATPKKKPVWEEFKLDPKATLFLDYTESSPDAILSIFSRTSGITILRDPSFKIPLTVTSAKAVSLDKAFGILNTVLGFHGYELQKKDDLLVVGKIPPPQQAPSMPGAPPPQPEVKTYPLTFANATQVARVLTDIFGAPANAGGGNNGGGPSFSPSFPGGMVVNGGGGGGGGGRTGNFKATSEDYSNSVIVQAMPADQTKAEALIKQLDKKTTQALESEVFALKYVPSDQAVSAIEDVLTANSPTGRGAKKADNNNNGGYFSFYDRYNSSPQRTAGGQSATAIKQTNSVIVNATAENMELVKTLLKNLDVQGAFVGTTFYVPLQNAKASDVADLLTKLFTTPRQNNDGGFFFFDGFGSNNNNKSQSSTDTDENGQVVNVRDIQGKVTVVADPNTNGLVVQTQPGNMKMIRPIIEKLDATVAQVMIETVIVEATLTKTDKLGVEYGTLGSILNGNGNGDKGSGSVDFGIGSATDLQGLKYTIGNPDYKIFLNAVQKDERFKVLDTPRVFTSNNAKAIIDVGQSVPYIANTQTNAVGGIVSNTQFVPVDVNLTVTPRITAAGQVSMDVVQTADDLAGFQNFGSNVVAPLVNKRSATTTATVGDGETIVLGGIIRHTTTNSVTKVPILGDLPVLGQLFRSNVKQSGQTELMVFLTPHIVRTLADARRQREDQTRELTKPSQDELKKIVPPVKAKP